MENVDGVVLIWLAVAAIAQFVGGSLFIERVLDYRAQRRWNRRNQYRLHGMELYESQVAEAIALSNVRRSVFRTAYYVTGLLIGLSVARGQYHQNPAMGGAVREYLAHLLLFMLICVFTNDVMDRTALWRRRRALELALGMERERVDIGLIGWALAGALVVVGGTQMSGFDSMFTEIMLNLALLAISAAAAFLVHWTRRNLSRSQIESAVLVARAAVEAVEQVGAMRGWTSSQKAMEAIERAKVLAEAAGISLDQNQWDTLIERAVAEIKMIEAELTNVDGVPQRKTSVLTPPEAVIGVGETG